MMGGAYLCRLPRRPDGDGVRYTRQTATHGQWNVKFKLCIIRKIRRRVLRYVRLSGEREPSQHNGDDFSVIIIFYLCTIIIL